MNATFIETQTAYIIERATCSYGDHPRLTEAAELLVRFLTDELGEGWPLRVFVPDGDDGWAFAVFGSDTTSYVHPDAFDVDANDGERARLVVEWYGTGWEPGCECEECEDGMHEDECPLSEAAQRSLSQSIESHALETLVQEWLSDPESMPDVRREALLDAARDVAGSGGVPAWLEFEREHGLTPGDAWRLAEEAGFGA